MEREAITNLHEILHKIQAWADNEEYIIPIFRRKSRGDKFTEKIIGEIKKVMQNEKLNIKNGVLIPTHYQVFISEADNNEWKAVKRASLCATLNNFVENCLRLTSVETFKKNFVSIYPAPEIKKGEIKVTHQWEESEAPIKIHFNQNPQNVNNQICEDFSEETIIAPAFWETEFEYPDADYETVVRPCLKKIFSLEIWRNGRFQNSLPIYQPQISIGRSSPSVAVDIRLSGDLEISRRHAVLEMESGGVFNIRVIGQNPVIVRETAVFAGQTTSCMFGETIKIGSYQLLMKS